MADDFMAKTSNVRRGPDVPLGPSLLPAARRRGARYFPMLALASAASITLVVGAWAVSGSGDSDDRTAEVARTEQRLSELDRQRKDRENALAELERKKSAKESELAEASERVGALEKRRTDLQRQIADLSAPISPPANERVTDYVGPDDAVRPIDAVDARSDGEAEAVAPTVTRSVPIPRPAPMISRASVDAESPADVSTASDDERMAGGGERAAGVEADAAEPIGEMAERAVAAGGTVRVFIHVRASDRGAIERAKAVAAELRRRGVDVAQIRGVPYPVRRDSVRFFYDADRAAAGALQRAVRDVSTSDGRAPAAQDFRSYGAPPRQGTMELWLS